MFAVGVVLLMTVTIFTVAPAGAAPPEKAHFEVVECFFEFDMMPDRSWFSGNDDKVWHVRGADNRAAEYVWDGESWAYIGENATVSNWNAFWTMTEFGPTPTAGSLWGDFVFTSEIGDFVGTWAWGTWPTGPGRLVGTAVGDDVDGRVNGWLSNVDPGWGDGDYPCEAPVFISFTVTSRD